MPSGGWVGWSTIRGLVRRARWTSGRSSPRHSPRAEESRVDALVEPAAGPTAGREPRDDRRGVERLRGEAVEGGDVQILYRSRARGEGDRRGRLVSGAAGER